MRKSSVASLGGKVLSWHSLALALSLGCTSKSSLNDREGTPNGGASTTGGNVGSGAAAGDAATAGGTNNPGAGGASGGAGASSSGGSGAGPMVVHGGPGCGFEEAAFCDTFDAPAAEAEQGRAGELSNLEWAAGRLAPQLPSGNGVAYGIGPSTIPECRPGIATSVYPDDDTVICDPTDTIQSNHLLVAAGAQNYGQNSYRIRQPFDFAGRTGKIVFDAEGFVENPLLGWISIDVTEDPTNAPNFSVGAENTNNDEGSLVPRNGFEVQFQNSCAGTLTPPAFGIRFLLTMEDHVTTEHVPSSAACIVGAPGKLSHFEIDVSQTQIDVYVSEPSDDGTTFPATTLLYSAPVNLPFSRGYVHISTHNHATLKYSNGGTMDAWIARWDNVGFDGPVLSHTREYEIADSLTPGTNAWNREGPVVSVGYRVPDEDSGNTEALTIPGVDITGATKAQISASTWNLNTAPNVGDVFLMYRINGGAFHDRPLTAGEVGVLTNTHSQGQLGQMFDVPLEELVNGDNTIEFISPGGGQGYPPLVANIDLILTTE
jgi:hypothetical protein